MHGYAPSHIISLTVPTYIAFHNCILLSSHGAGNIRLVTGSVPSEGRVELFYEGEWGRVVVNSSNSDTVARVACRQAGYPYTEGTGSFEQGSGPVWVVISWCTGDEERVEQCFHYGWHVNLCLSCPDLGVRCRGKCVVCEEHTHTPYQAVLTWLKSPQIVTPSPLPPYSCRQASL